MLGNNIAIPGLAASPNPTINTRLLSGETFLIPVGTWMFRLGGQSALQWFDYNASQWRILEAGVSNHPIPVSSDGTNFRVINLSGTILGANITTPGTVYTQAGTTIAFAAPVTGGITATGTPVIGGSLSLTVTGGSGGTGYTNPMVIIPVPQNLGGTPGLCIPALASVAVSSGVLGAFTMNYAGAGYVTAPGSNTNTVTPAQFAANPYAYLSDTDITIVDPAGTGAQVIASITNGTATSGGLTGIVMSNMGSLYDGTHIPAVTITCSGSSGTAAATALPWMALTGVTVGSTNTGYTASAMIETTLTSGTAIAALNGEPVLARPGRAIAAQSGGALGTPTVEDAGGGFQTVPLAKQVGNATADGSVNATFVSVVGGVTNTLLGWQVG
jgi:hypothetical protein